MTQLTLKTRSLSYPPRIFLGSLQTQEAPTNIGNQLLMFCQTIKGERPLLPDWGLPELIHRPIIKASEVEAIILSNVTRYFPQVKIAIACELNPNILGVATCQIDYESPVGYGVIIIEV